MKLFEKSVRLFSHVGAALGGFFLITIMLAIVLDICLRLLRIPIISSYDLTQVFIVVTVAFALPYTAIRKAHVVVEILVSRFSNKAQGLSSAITSFFTLIFWSLIIKASIDMIQKKWTGEFSFNLNIPYLPFRFIWVIGLCLFAIIYMIEIIDTTAKLRKDK